MNRGVFLPCWERQRQWGSEGERGRMAERDGERRIEGPGRPVETGTEEESGKSRTEGFGGEQGRRACEGQRRLKEEEAAGAGREADSKWGTGPVMGQSALWGDQANRRSSST